MDTSTDERSKTKSGKDVRVVKFLDGSEKEVEITPSANLRDANLRDANLRGAYLEGADLRDADFVGADLRGADLRGADFVGADLRDADFVGADLRGADLRGVNLRGVNLRRANLVDADLVGAYLRLANLEGANLEGANLRDANLVDANLRDANLRNAGLTDAKLPHFQICPEKGSFRAFKKIHTADPTDNGYQVIEIEIAASAKRTSSLIGRKCRASKARIVTKGVNGHSLHDAEFKYVSGQELVVDDYDGDIRIECTRGIHFFMTQIEAEEYLK